MTSDDRQDLTAFVEKYTRSFPSFKPKSSSSSVGPAVVLLSGSTGAFGSNILAALVASSDVGLIYGVSRPSLNSLSVYKRHLQAFRREGIEPSILKNGKVKLIEGDLSAEKFGMSRTMYQEVR